MPLFSYDRITLLRRRIIRKIYTLLLSPFNSTFAYLIIHNININLLITRIYIYYSRNSFHSPSAERECCVGYGDTLSMAVRVDATHKYQLRRCDFHKGDKTETETGFLLATIGGGKLCDVAGAIKRSKMIAIT